MSSIKKYRFAIVAIALTVLLFMYDSVKGARAMQVTFFSLREMMLIIPPIFILLGLLDSWVPKETMVRFMGKGSGLKGILLAFFLGSAAAGPLYGAFPVASVLMQKGASYTNVLILLGAWSTTKIPLMLFEMGSLGLPFALTRLMINIPGILIIAWTVDYFLSDNDKERIYSNAREMTN